MGFAEHFLIPVLKCIQEEGPNRSITSPIYCQEPKLVGILLKCGYELKKVVWTKKIWGQYNQPKRERMA